MPVPVWTVIAGPNGAGKTTFALTYLVSASHSRNFVNADLIAAGLSPLDPDREAVEAGRLFLREVRRFIADRESFAFETTLSGRNYLRMIRELVATGWEVHLVYLWLPGVATCRERVAERVSRGGHDIPAETIERRYFRSVRNLLKEYAAACTVTICYDNSGLVPIEIFSQHGKSRIIQDDARYCYFSKTSHHD
jgi:predicted ABC-type ATPase